MMMKCFRTQSRFFTIVVASALCVAISSCTDRALDKRQAEYETAQDALDRGQPDRAIQILQPRLEATPQDMRARLLLASAYAFRAGIFVRDFFDLARQISRSSAEVEKLIETRGGLFDELKRNTVGSNESQIVVGFERVMKATLHVDALIRGFRTLPVPINETGRQDLRKAIDILGYESRYTRNPALYRALLRLSLFKYDLKDRYDFSYLSNCEVDLGHLVGQLSDLRFDLSRVLEDIALGTMDPDQQEEIRQFARNIATDVGVAVEVFRGLQKSGVDVSSIMRDLYGKCEA